uniref:Uncharacterized protein n=1 Tax=Crocodylus porosus TaxID=8502 RepID=A0A7M4G230_CROPO
MQPQLTPSPTLHPNLTDPALRANPYPKVTDPRLFTLETCCGYGYGPVQDLHLLPRIFKDQRELTGHYRNHNTSQGSGPSLGANPFQGILPFTKKRELSPGLLLASLGSVVLPHWMPCSSCHRLPSEQDGNPTRPSE